MLEKPAAEEQGGGLGPAGQRPGPGHPRRWGRLCFASLPAPGMALHMPGTYTPIRLLPGHVPGIISNIAGGRMFAPVKYQGGGSHAGWLGRFPAALG